MPIEITMPALSPTMESGNLAKWLVKKGDAIKPGQVIAEVMTDKASMELEAVESGIIGEILVPEGSNVKVQSVIAILLNKGEDPSILNNYKPTPLASDSIKETSYQTPQKIDQPTKPKEVINAAATLIGNNDINRIIASPLAKRIATEKNINLSNVAGSGPQGRIIKRDLENLNASYNNQISRSSDKANIPGDRQNIILPLSPMRKVIASRLVESKSTIPHFYLSLDCNITKLLEMRQSLNLLGLKDEKDIPVKVSVNDIMIKAVASALKHMPTMNVSWNNDSIIQYGSIDISVAVSIQDGLITPIIFNADLKGLLEISTTMKELAAKARANKLTPAEFQGGSISISNLGMYGIKQFQAIINPPQACIVAIGSSEKQPLVNEKNEISIADIMNITMSVDHRVIDGALAAEFLQLLKKIIENPIALSI